MLVNQLKKPAQVRESVLAIIVMLTICYMSYNTFYSPKKKLATELSDKVTKIEAEIKSVTQLNQTLQKKYEEQEVEMKKESKEVASQNQKLQMIQRSMSPEYRNISDFLSAVTHPRFRIKLVIDSFKYDAPKKEKGFTSSVFKITASGKFQNMVEFIRKLEEVPALVSLDNISIKISDKDTSLVFLDLSGTFYQLEQDNG